ncbi:MAG: DUF3071 domain-containing protein, partial [Leucobacter sp.]|nr:DUF3071 domain-containing protein [Leucobacter sp.]
AEQRYMLDLAHAVTVRTDPSQAASGATPAEDEQRFGQVVSERLIGLGNNTSSWRSWRDEEAGWLIGLTFDSRDGDHDAVWSFDHKKRVLSPLTPDATNLSKLGEIGDRLIPKLRAVDNDQRERAETESFDPDGLLAPTAEVQPLPATNASGTAATEEPGTNPDAEYERRREIDQLAVNTPLDGEEDLSQTADLLDALRRRRGERSLEAEAAAGAGEESDDPVQHDAARPSPAAELGLTPRPAEKPRTGAAANIWGTSGVSGAAGGKTTTSLPDDTAQLRVVRPHPPQAPDDAGRATTGKDDRTSESSEPAAEERSSKARESAAQRDAKGGKRGRSSIPSWDDILFGTRSDDDPA